MDEEILPIRGTLCFHRTSKWVALERMGVLAEWVQAHPFLDVTNAEIFLLRHFGYLCETRKLPLFSSLTEARGNDEQPLPQRQQRYFATRQATEDLDDFRLHASVDGFVEKQDVLYQVDQDYKRRMSLVPEDRMQAFGQRRGSGAPADRPTSDHCSMGAKRQVPSDVFDTKEDTDAVHYRGCEDTDFKVTQRMMLACKSQVQTILSSNIHFQQNNWQCMQYVSEINNAVNCALVTIFNDNMLVKSCHSDGLMGVWMALWQDYGYSNMTRSQWDMRQRMKPYTNDGYNAGMLEQNFHHILTIVDKLFQVHDNHILIWELYCTIINASRPRKNDEEPKLNRMISGRSAKGKSYSVKSAIDMTIPHSVMCPALVTGKALVGQGNTFDGSLVYVDEGTEEQLEAQSDTNGKGPGAGSERMNIMKTITDKGRTSKTIENGRGQPGVKGRTVIVSECANPGGVIICTNCAPKRINPNLRSRFLVSVGTKKAEGEGDSRRADFAFTGGMAQCVNKSQREKPTAEEHKRILDMFHQLHWATSYVQYLEGCGVLEWAWDITKDTVNSVAKGMKRVAKLEQRETDRVFAFSRVHHIVLTLFSVLFSSAGHTNIHSARSPLLSTTLGGKDSVAWSIYETVRLATAPSQLLTVQAIGMVMPHIWDPTLAMLGPYAYAGLMHHTRVQKINSPKLDDSDLQDLPFVQRTSAHDGSVATDFDWIETGKNETEFVEWMCNITGLDVYEVGKAMEQLQSPENPVEYKHRKEKLYNNTIGELKVSPPITTGYNQQRRSKTVYLLLQWVLDSCRMLPRHRLIDTSDGSGKRLPTRYTSLHPTQTVRENFYQAAAEAIQPDVPTGARFFMGTCLGTEQGTQFAVPEQTRIEDILEMSASCRPASQRAKRGRIWPTPTLFHRFTAAECSMFCTKRKYEEPDGSSDDGAETTTAVLAEQIVQAETLANQSGHVLHHASARGLAILNGTLPLHQRDETDDFQLLVPNPSACVVAVQRVPAQPGPSGSQKVYPDAYVARNRQGGPAELVGLVWRTRGEEFPKELGVRPSYRV